MSGAAKSSDETEIPVIRKVKFSHENFIIENKSDIDSVNGDCEPAMETDANTSDRPSFTVGEEAAENGQEATEDRDDFNQNLVTNGIRMSHDLAEKRKRLR